MGTICTEKESSFHYQGKHGNNGNEFTMVQLKEIRKAPKSIKEAIAIGAENGDTLWQNTIREEMKNSYAISVCPYLRLWIKGPQFRGQMISTLRTILIWKLVFGVV